jgi:hypothetical protein
MFALDMNPNLKKLTILLGREDMSSTTQLVTHSSQHMCNTSNYSYQCLKKVFLSVYLLHSM